MQQPVDRKLQGKPKVLLECIPKVDMELLYRRSTRPIKQKSYDKEEGYQVPEIKKTPTKTMADAKNEEGER